MLIRVFYAFVLGLLLPWHSLAQDIPQDKPNPVTVELARLIARDLFELNSIPYLEPLVISANASSNAGFFHSAFVPTKDTFYIRFGIATMTGFVGDDRQTYKPQIATDTDPSLEVSDGVPFLYDRLKGIFAVGIETGEFFVPNEASTIFGPTDKTPITIPKEFLLEEIRKDPVYQLLPEDWQNSVDDALSSLPDEQELPGGIDIKQIFAAVPQLEIGTLYGSELLLRYIPPVRFSEEVGDISFWGVALKHSLSQYFGPDPIFDLAIQGAYQHTSIENTIGVTEAKLEADADIFNFNIHASKRYDVFDFYTGLSLERIDVRSTYTYTLPRETQISLNLLRKVSENPDIYEVQLPDYPGDDQPQVSEVSLDNNNVKWVVGAMATLGPVSLFVDYSISQFNILAGGFVVGF